MNIPPLDFVEAPSPNFDARTAPPEILVLHYTGMKTGPEALAYAIAAEIGRPVSYRPVETDGAARAAALLAELI